MILESEVEIGTLVRIKTQKELDAADPEWRDFWAHGGEMDHMMDRVYPVHKVADGAVMIADPTRSVPNEYKHAFTWLFLFSHVELANRNNSHKLPKSW